MRRGSTPGSAGDVTGITAGTGITVTNPGGPSPTIAVTQRLTGTGTWSDAAAHALITLATETDKSYSLIANVVSKRQVAGAGNNETNGYVLHATFENDNGSLALVGASSALSTREDTAACNCVFVANGTSIELQVVGVNLSEFVWVGMLDYVVVG